MEPCTSDTADFSKLDDPAFIAERRRVRCQLEATPRDEVSPALLRRAQDFEDEFLRRARIAWSQAS